jgi:Holliday junction resolvase
MTPEAKVKKKVKAILDELGAYHFFPLMGGFGRAGVPDIIGCYQGCFFAIECKAGSNKTTELQERELEKIRRAGGVAIVINDGNLEDVKATIQAHSSNRL